MRLFRLVIFFFAPLLFAAAARSQTVRWSADSGQPNVVQLVFENCAPNGQPTLPPIAGASLTYVGQAENMSIVNMQVSRSITISYFVRARQNGPVQIPAFTVQTDKGPVQVAAFSTSPATALESVASAKLTPERTTVWAGEVFGLTYELLASRRSNPHVNQTFEWNAAPLIAEDWSTPEVTESQAGGDRKVSVLYRSRAFAKTPNTLRLEAANHLLNIQTGTVGFGFLSQPRMDQISVVSDQPVIEVRPLPPSPAGFSGAVGEFKIVSKVVPEKAAVGEPVTWTIELSGTGNWPDIAGLPARDVSNDFEVVQPKAKRTPAEGKLFDVTLAEDVVLVPTKAGSYTLGPLTFTYFDPRSASYKTITAPRTSVTITAPGGSSAPVGSLNGNESDLAKSDDVQPAARARAVSTPTPPAGLPRDPLPGADVVAAPMSRGTMTLLSLSPAAGLLGLWLWLAIRRAQYTDPVRPRREARARLAHTLSHLQTAAEPDRASLLLAWQRDTAILWQIPHAAPPADALPDAGWSKLWHEAERALYGAQAALPPDWMARAQEALAAKQVPGFRPHRLFLPRNLFPFAAALALLAVLSFPLLEAADASAPGATDPSAAYRRGDFAAAEKAWRAAIASAPTNWIARHNLSLALAQQERAGEAAGHAAAAFVQAPANPSVRWHFALATEKAGAAPAALAMFRTPGLRHALARAASPATWQRLVVVASFVSAAALGWMLCNAYGRGQRRVYRTAAIVLAISLIALGSALTSVFSYGIAGDARAALVARSGTLRSIPTEVDTTQKTTALAAGTMGVTAKTFLGWIQLEFENGQTGWVRQEEIVPLWK